MRLFFCLLAAGLALPSFSCENQLIRVGNKLYRPLYSTNVAALNATKINKVFPAPNIAAVPPEKWLAPDNELGEQTELRRKLYFNRPDDVFKVKEEYRDRILKVSKELLEEMAGHLVKDFPQQYSQEGNNIIINSTGRKISLTADELHPLVKAGFLVQDDITLNLPNEQGEPILVAGFLATPTHWSLDDFLGQTPHQIHSQVANYEKIRKPVDGASRGNIGGILGRNNWFIETNHELAMPDYRTSTYPIPRITKRNAADALVLRSELESIKKLSDGIAFTIRPRVFTLRWIKENAPEKAKELAEGIAAPGSGYREQTWAKHMVPYLGGDISLLTAEEPSLQESAKGAPAVGTTQVVGSSAQRSSPMIPPLTQMKAAVISQPTNQPSAFPHAKETAELMELPKGVSIDAIPQHMRHLFKQSPPLAQSTNTESAPITPPGQ